MHYPEWYTNRSGKISVYHGTLATYSESFKRHGVKIRDVHGKIRDFGNGFYSTLHKDQAVDYAFMRATLKAENPMLVLCELEVVPFLI